MNDELYYEKVKNWNSRIDYKKDIDMISLLTNYCLSKVNSTDLYFIGTGLGADIDSIVISIKLKSITGIEPLKIFFDNALAKYEKIGATLRSTMLPVIHKCGFRLDSLRDRADSSRGAHPAAGKSHLIWGK